MYNSKGTIFNMQRFSTSDGPGIRTVVFLKGCPLNCTWCHNPESKSVSTEIFYSSECCIGCRACEVVCSKSRHNFTNRHLFERDGCISCRKCVAVCPSHALEACGETKTAAEIIEIVLRDRPFYDTSGGGLTLSGGEPLMQYDFSLFLLRLSKKNGLHTAIETSGFSHKDLTEIHTYTDLWLYDIKLFPEDAHRKYTGVSNEIILKNLHYLDSIGAKIILRCPIIPGINLSLEHFHALAKLSNQLSNVISIHLEPYHPLGISKAKKLNKTQVYENEHFLKRSAIDSFADELRTKTNIEVAIL